MPSPIAYIDSTGFHRTRLDGILALMNAKYYAIYGTGIDIDPETTDGEQIGAWAEALSDVASLAEAVHLGRSPAGAMGAALSRLVRLNAIRRQGARYSTADATLVGDPGTVVHAGDLASTDAAPPATFLFTADVTIGESGTATTTLRATVPGPITAPAGHLNKMVTVINGLTSITNAADAAPGRFYETDADLRVRRAASVATPSQGITDGLWGALLDLPNVADARVFENFTDTVNALGMPRHSIWAIVDGGDPGDIGSTMWKRKAPGCSLVGSVVQTVSDSQGLPQTMRFDRPTDVPIYVKVTLSAAVGSDVAAAIASAIALDGVARYGIGDSVQWFKTAAPITNAAPDVDVVSVFLGTAPAPTLEADVAILPTQVSRWDISRITVGT